MICAACQDTGFTESGGPCPDCDVHEDYVPEGVWATSNGAYRARCRSCGETYELNGGPDEFDEDTNYCGGSDRCLP